MSVTLYKTDTKGKVRVLIMRTERNTLIQESGLLNGNLVKNERVCHGKNIGRSNETSPEDQAVQELSSKIESKIKEGYFYSMEEAIKTEVISPMLAKEYGKEKHKVDWEKAWAQPKLDGMRCHMHIGQGKLKLMSRTGTEITTVEHVIKAFEKSYLINHPDVLILDGELYAHGLSFQENMKLIKKYRGEESHVIQFHIYDQVHTEPFLTRYAHTVSHVSESVYPYVQNVFTQRVYSEEGLQSLHKAWLTNGYEGSILRWGNEPYKVGGRSSNLLKYKDFLDSKVKIVAVIPMEARPEQGIFVCTMNGEEFRATPKCSHIQKERILQEKELFIGKEIEVRYFELTDGGIPRFPVALVDLD